MRPVYQPITGMLRRLVRLVLSVPVYCKIIGVGILVSGLIGSVSAYLINYELYTRLLDHLKSDSILIGRLAGHQAAHAIAVDDKAAVRNILSRLLQDSDEIEFVIVENNRKEAYVKLYASNLNPTRLPSRVQTANSESPILWETGDGIVVVESVTPILNGQFGVVRVGLNDRKISASLKEVNRRFSIALAFCIIVGQLLALLVTYYLTKPIHHLAGRAKDLAQGDYSARAVIFFDDEIGALAEAFNTAAVNIEIARHALWEKERIRAELVKKLVQQSEEDRRLISQELHDQVGQSLSLLLLRAETSACGVGDGYKCPLCLDLKNELTSLIGEVRNMAFLLRPPELDDYGLDSAFKRYATKITDRSRLKVDYEYIGEDAKHRLPEEVEITLYRVTQEAVTNVIKHARAEHVSIIFLQRETAVLMIEDDGVGFDTGNYTPGLGILGMRERVAMVGGDILVESSPGDGTTVKITIPTIGAPV